MVEKLTQTSLFLSNIELSSLNYREYHHRVFFPKLFMNITTVDMIVALQARKGKLCLWLDMMWVKRFMRPVEHRTSLGILRCRRRTKLIRERGCSPQEVETIIREFWSRRKQKIAVLPVCEIRLVQVGTTSCASIDRSSVEK
jgi:hypothetical protein